jgi:FkbM family methyltransferase
MKKILHSKKIEKTELIRKILVNPAAHRIQRNFKKFSTRGDPQLVVFSHDLIGNAINTDGVYEKQELDLLFSWLHNVDYDFSTTFVDIGANIGNHSLYFSRIFNKIISFEPNPRVFKLLKLNAELSNNIECHELALSDKNGVARISFNTTNMGGASLNLTGQRSVEVVTSKLDDFAINEKIGIIKIDVEGHELNVLHGASETIKKNQPIILFEQHIEDFIEGKSPVIDLLKIYGYNDFITAEFTVKISRSLFKNIFLNLLKIISFGGRGELRLTSNIKPDFYPFIIAIPASMSDKIKNI